MELETQLAQLEGSQILRKSLEDELAYLFKHALTQETAYQSLLLKTRREIHLRVAQCYEELYPEQLDKNAALLASHYAEAGDLARALHYEIRAAEGAARVYANSEAIEHYGRAIELARKTGAGSELTRLYLRRGRGLELGSRYEEALTNYRELEDVGRERDDPSMRLASLIARATLRSTPTPAYDYEQGRALGEQSLALAQQLGDRESEARVLWNLMNLHVNRGELQASARYGGAVLALVRDLGESAPRELLAYVLNDVSRPFAGLGQITRAIELLDEARQLWRGLGNLTMLTDNLGRSSRLASALGDYDRAIAFSEEAYPISRTTGNLWGQAFSRMFTAGIYFERGDPGRAIELLTETLRLGTRAGFALTQVVTRAELGWAYGMLGAVEHGITLARESLQFAEERLASWRAPTVTLLVRLYVRAGDLDAAGQLLAGQQPVNSNFISDARLTIPIELAQAEFEIASQNFAGAIRVADQMLEFEQKFGLRSVLPEALYLKAKALLALDRIDEAEPVLTRARAEAGALGSRRMLWQILAALSEIQRRRGNQNAADDLNQQARQILEYFANHIPSSELRASFLNLADVQQVLFPNHTTGDRQLTTSV